MKIRHKVTLLGVLSIATLLLFLFATREHQLERYRMVDRLASSLVQTGVVLELVHELQRERGLNTAYLTATDDEDFLKINRQWQRVDEVLDAAISDETLKSELRRIRVEVLRRDITYDAVIRFYSWQVSQLFDRMTMHNRGAWSAEVQQTFISLTYLSQAKEYSGQLRAEVTARLNVGGVDPLSARRLSNLVALADSNFIQFEKVATESQLELYQNEIRNPAVAKVIRELLMVGRSPGYLPEMTSDEWFKASSYVIDQIQLVESQLRESLLTIALAERRSVLREVTIITIAAITAALLMAVLTFWIIRSILNPLDRLVNGVSHIVETGEFSQGIDCAKRRIPDEFCLISDKFNSVVELAHKLMQEKDHLARIDPLTGISNRMGGNEELTRQRANSDQSVEQCGFAMIMFDIDHFKEVNDQHGHNVGDEVLCHFSNLILGQIRDEDLFARWGGEEFLLLLPKRTIDQAVEIAERILRHIAAYDFPHVGRVTVSAGVASYRNGKESEVELVQRADEALYRAKEGGRNRVVVAR